MPLVMIVDDSPTEVHVLQKYLRKEGYETFAVHSAKQGIAMARERKPDLILMDVVMPEISGFEATRKLSKDPETSAIPVIMVTTKDLETDRVWGMRQGAEDYLIKPVSQKKLMTTVRAVLGQAS